MYRCTTGNPEGAVHDALAFMGQEAGAGDEPVHPDGHGGETLLHSVRVFLARYRAMGLEGTFALPCSFRVGRTYSFSYHSVKPGSAAAVAVGHRPAS
jgi:hypothetical protein